MKNRILIFYHPPPFWGHRLTFGVLYWIYWHSGKPVNQSGTGKVAELVERLVIYITNLKKNKGKTIIIWIFNTFFIWKTPLNFIKVVACPKNLWGSGLAQTGSHGICIGEVETRQVSWAHLSRKGSGLDGFFRSTSVAKNGWRLIRNIDGIKKLTFHPSFFERLLY